MHDLTTLLVFSLLRPIPWLTDEPAANTASYDPGPETDCPF
jgi:hypothetical protein